MVLANSGKVAPVARDFGINEQTLRNWVNAHHQRVPDSEPPLTMNERARLRELERENIELREKTRFLGKSAAFFAREHQ